MSIVKKIACLLLVLALCLSVGGCTKKKKQVVIIKRPAPGTSDSAGDTNNDNNFDDDVDEEVYESFRELAAKVVTEESRAKEYVVTATSFNLSDEYTVVYPEGNIQLKQSAKKLVEYFEKNGFKLALASDVSTAKEKEILVGDTNRHKSSLAENKYAVSVVDNKLVFESGNFNGVIKAVSWFISFEFKKGSVNTLTGEYDFSASINRADGTYQFVWGDEFDGNALDTNKWDLTSSISAESSFKLSRDPAALNVSDGLLKLTALRWFDADNNQIQAIAPYTVEGKKFMNYQYGYLEMKARIPFSNGAWPSLWLSGACREGAVVSSLYNRGDIIPSNFSAEIDIVEYTTLQPNMHKWFYGKEY